MSGCQLRAVREIRARLVECRLRIAQEYAHSAGNAAPAGRRSLVADIQQEQLVLTFVDRNGSITRREATELCQIDSERASRLLRRLRDEGSLEMHGVKRSACYVMKHNADNERGRA